MYCNWYELSFVVVMENSSNVIVISFVCMNFTVDYNFVLLRLC